MIHMDTLYSDYWSDYFDKGLNVTSVNRTCHSWNEGSLGLRLQSF